MDYSDDVLSFVSAHNNQHNTLEESRGICPITLWIDQVMVVSDPKIPVLSKEAFRAQYPFKASQKKQKQPKNDDDGGAQEGTKPLMKRKRLKSKHSSFSEKRISKTRRKEGK